MADFQPFRGLRYSPATDAGAVLSPPYDVVDADEQAALIERSPHNVIRLELSIAGMGEAAGGRYTAPAETLREWRRSGVLAQDAQASFYVYTQEFEHEGGRRRRGALLGRLRLEPWDTGVVRPHEETGRAAKEDRLLLLRHLHANVSPLFSLYRDPAGSIGEAIGAAGEPALDTRTPDGERHTLQVVNDASAIERIAAVFRETPLYIADGHHRYETALAYRDECRARAASWTGDEPENFVLMALVAADDPGLVLLPTHRLVRPPSLPNDLFARLDRFFQVDDTTPKSYDGTALLRLLARVAAAGNAGTAFGALGLEEGRLHLLTLRDGAAARALMPAGSAAWQALDVNVLEYAVLRETLGMDVLREAQDQIGAVGYTDDARRALEEVESGRWPLAFLLNATPVEQVLAVADAGERMPRKSTYFYPKLATGLVLYAFE
ncbi:MAG: DUF1015 domain-containing protein [Dehalococcoidia bacterium]